MRSLDCFKGRRTSHLLILVSCSVAFNQFAAAAIVAITAIANTVTVQSSTRLDLIKFAFEIISCNLDFFFKCGHLVEHPPSNFWKLRTNIQFEAGKFVFTFCQKLVLNRIYS